MENRHIYDPLKVTHYEYPHHAGALTQDERETLRDIMGPDMETLERAYTHLGYIWEDNFSGPEPKPLPAGIVEEIGEHLMMIQDEIWEVLLNYSLNAAETTFRGYKPAMQKFQEALTAYEVDQLSATAEKIIHRLKFENNEGLAAAKAIYEAARTSDDRKAKVMLQGLIDDNKEVARRAG